jgi:hypothetical protein
MDMVQACAVKHGETSVLTTDGQPARGLPGTLTVDTSWTSDKFVFLQTQGNDMYGSNPGGGGTGVSGAMVPLCALAV